MQRSTLYRLRLDLSHVDRGVYENLNLTVVQHPSETLERVVLRILAYSFCYQEGLEYTRGVCIGDEPDFWLREPDGQVKLWGEVGLPEAKRLLRVAPHCEQLFLLASGTKQQRWQEQNLSDLQAINNLTVYALDWAWVQQLAAGMRRSAQWQLTISDGEIYLSDGEQDMSTALDNLT